MENIIGTITPPPAYSKFGAGGIGNFIGRIFQVLIIFAGIYALFNLVIAGYGFMSAGDDPKKMAAAWAKIWQTLLGLAFAAGAVVLGAIFGRLIFGDATIILNPQIPEL